MQPFANTLVTLNLTGAQIKQVLEEQWQPAGASRPFLKLGVNKELEYTYNPAAPAGNAHHRDAPERRRRSIPPRRTRSVRTRSSPRVETTSSPSRAGTNKADSGKIDLESMVDYFAAAPATRSRPTPRSARSACTSAATARYAPGELVTVNLSSLDFSRTEPAAGTVVVSFGGAQLDTAPVDRAYTPTVDEIGKATWSSSRSRPAPQDRRGSTSRCRPPGTTSSFVLNVG